MTTLPRPTWWPQPRPRPRRSVRRRGLVGEEEAIMVGEMFEVVERGEMMTRELLMLEDILVLEVAMRLLAWDCNKMNHAFRFRLGNFPDTTRDFTG